MVKVARMKMLNWRVWLFCTLYTLFAGVTVSTVAEWVHYNIPLTYLLNCCWMMQQNERSWNSMCDLDFSSLTAKGSKQLVSYMMLIRFCHAVAVTVSMEGNLCHICLIRLGKLCMPSLIDIVHWVSSELSKIPTLTILNIFGDIGISPGIGKHGKWADWLNTGGTGEHWIQHITFATKTSQVWCPNHYATKPPVIVIVTSIAATVFSLEWRLEVLCLERVKEWLLCCQVEVVTQQIWAGVVCCDVDRWWWHKPWSTDTSLDVSTFAYHTC